jgi:SAM-dependent methyltransferase
VVRTLQRWLRPLEHTPLHPQWLVLRHRREIAAWVTAHARGTLVDVGCGNGRLRRDLPPSVRYVGIDYPATVALGYAGTADILADAAGLPIATASVDVVTLLDVLEHLREPARAVGEAARVLRTGGKCLVHVPFLYPLHDEPHDYQRWTRHGLQRLFASGGFEVAEIRETTHPMESAAALLAMALASGMAGAIEHRRAAVVLAPLVLLLIPLANLLGWGLARVLPASSFMPFSYRVLVERRTSDDRQAPEPC